MSLRKCEACGEETDEAKAFCPECGNPFVEEDERKSASDFDKQAGTVDMSKSMFQEMLGDMDLDTSSATPPAPEPVPAATPAPTPDAKPVPVPETAETKPKGPVEGHVSRKILLSPIAVEEKQPEPAKQTNTKLVIALAVVFGLVIVLGGVAVVAIVFYFYFF